MTPLHRLPAHLVNGLAVAAGIACIQLTIGALAGPQAAQLALSGAICTGVADAPNTPPRTLNRVAASALLSFNAALAVALAKGDPLTLGATIALIGFVSAMTLAWGPRAGAVSFAPILSMVFAMALPAGAAPLATIATWNAIGSVAYLGWALAAASLLQPRYRALALAQALAASAALMRARAELMRAEVEETGAMQAWIEGEANLAEQLQAARDFVFAEPDTEVARRHAAILLRTIELRDLLLGSRLDLERLGDDVAARWTLLRVADALCRIGQALDEAAQALRDAGPPPLLAPLQFGNLFAGLPIAAGDPRARLLPAVADRLTHLAGNVMRVHALLHGAREDSPLNPTELGRFVAPEGWPLRALRAHRSGRSPVLRHAVRSALALGCAYAIGEALPWAAHPHWLVLSVAVVLRGNLEQTLMRRNARVLGTLAGCAVVLTLTRLESPALLTVVFLAAVATTHAFVMRRYWLSTSADTVMALLQARSVNPTGKFEVGERIADTLLGAALAWGFSYVLPAWERRALPQAIQRVLHDLSDYAAKALAPRAGDGVEQRLARRRAYDALAALAAALRRSLAEPKAVQLPLRDVAALIDHGQRLMAHLSLVRMTLSQGGVEGRGPQTAREMADARAELAACLALPLAARGAATPPAARGEPGAAAPEADPGDLALLPPVGPEQDSTPWLLRRLRVLKHDARQVRAAAHAALEQVRRPVRA